MSIAATWSSDNLVVWIGYSNEVGHRMQVIVAAIFCPFLVYNSNLVLGQYIMITTPIRTIAPTIMSNLSRMISSISQPI